jgi:hypothetical protein
MENSTLLGQPLAQETIKIQSVPCRSVCRLLPPFLGVFILSLIRAFVRRRLTVDSSVASSSSDAKAESSLYTLQSSVLFRLRPSWSLRRYFETPMTTTFFALLTRLASIIICLMMLSQLPRIVAVNWNCNTRIVFRVPSSKTYYRPSVLSDLRLRVGYPYYRHYLIDFHEIGMEVMSLETSVFWSLSNYLHEQ